MGFVQGAVTLLNRTNCLNTSGCQIPELSIRNSDGEWGCGTVEATEYEVEMLAVIGASVGEP